MKLISTLTRMDYVATDFFWWRFVSKVKLLRLRETNKPSRLGSIINNNEIRKNKIHLLNLNTHVL